MRGKGVRGRKWSEGEGSVYVCGGERGGWEGEEGEVEGGGSREDLL